MSVVNGGAGPANGGSAEFTVASIHGSHDGNPNDRSFDSGRAAPPSHAGSVRQESPPLDKRDIAIILLKRSPEAVVMLALFLAAFSYAVMVLKGSATPMTAGGVILTCGTISASWWIYNVDYKLPKADCEGLQIPYPWKNVAFRCALTIVPILLAGSFGVAGFSAEAVGWTYFGGYFASSLIKVIHNKYREYHIKSLIAKLDPQTAALKILNDPSLTGYFGNFPGEKGHLDELPEEHSLADFFINYIHNQIHIVDIPEWTAMHSRANVSDIRGAGKNSLDKLLGLYHANGVLKGHIDRAMTNSPLLKDLFEAANERYIYVTRAGQNFMKSLLFLVRPQAPPPSGGGTPQVNFVADGNPPPETPLEADG